jgi:hypothetical protein
LALPNHCVNWEGHSFIRNSVKISRLFLPQTVLLDNFAAASWLLGLSKSKTEFCQKWLTYT